MKFNALFVSVRLIASALFAAVVFACHVIFAEQPTPTANQRPEPEETVKRQLAVMRRLAKTIKVTALTGDERQKAKLIDEPLYRFSDQSRLHSDGSVWAWAVGGRPVAMTELRTYNRIEGVWGCDLVVTSDLRLSAEIAEHGRWAPSESDLKLVSAPNLAPPAKTEAGRLRQMKQFARHFSASEIWQGQRSELRLLPTEAHRYSDPTHGMIDGAVFIFAVGSNPETILVVEAQKTGPGVDAPGIWKYGLARMSAAAITFQLGDTVVWEVPESHGGTNVNYYSFRLSSPNAGPSRD